MSVVSLHENGNGQMPYFVGFRTAQYFISSIDAVQVLTGTNIVLFALRPLFSGITHL